jgi:heme exporter protein D
MLQVFPTCEKTVLNIRTQQTFLKEERRRRRRRRKKKKNQATKGFVALTTAA